MHPTQSMQSTPDEMIVREITVKIALPMLTTDAVDIAVHDFLQDHGITPLDVSWVGLDNRH